MATSIRQAVELLASTTVTADSTGTTAVRLLDRIPNVQGIVFVLDVTDADTNVDDTLDVFVQTKCDGTNWVDVVAFTQLLGNGSDTVRHVGKILASAATTMFENATALTAGNVRHLFGEEWRVRYDFTDGGGAGTAQFVISVTATPL